MNSKIRKIVWDDATKHDLEEIYHFNKENFSEEFADKIRDEIFEAVSDLYYTNQWVIDPIMGKPYRRILVRYYRIVYLAKNENLIYILRVFDGRRNPKGFKLNQ